MDFLNPAFWTFVAVIAGIYAILSLGLYVQFSLAGLPNFGHVAFMAVAAYTMAILVVRYAVPMPLAAGAGLIGAVVLALVLGIPTLRLRADYLAIATVAGGEIIRYLAMNLPDLTGGPIGSIGLLGPGQIALYNGGWLAFLDRLAS
ncbi:MAG TPA: branched-chain amino acid ABC transporter permease, partial [Caulobacteraceae bacterium]|nr:branched-chain amino acid ABC transporter permease [Caulobacteraceae bacterium]